jgi:DNA polymerase-4
MPGRRARELCPQLTFVPSHFKEHQRLGDAAIAVLNDFTPLVERISVDEAFADVAGCTHLFGPPADSASGIRHRIRVEPGLPISIGVARTKHLARIASQVAKPDGLVVVDPRTELDFLHDLPVELMWGVGPVTRARPAEIDVHRRTRGLSAFPAAARFGSRRNATVGRGGSLSGVHPAIALAHCRACPLSAGLFNALN